MKGKQKLQEWRLEQQDRNMTSATLVTVFTAATQDI